MKTLFAMTLSVILLLQYSAFSQNAVDSVYFPKVGDAIPPYNFKDVVNYQRNEVSLSDFRGKWLILDWWAPGCLGCIASFSKMDHLSKTFKDRTEIMMIGLQGTHNAISGTKKFYLSQEKKRNLNMIAAFDSTSFDVFNIGAVPLVLVVDPKGIIVAKTLSIDSSQLRKLINGEKDVLYEYAYSKNEKSRSNFSFKIPLLTSGRESNGGVDTDFISRSILAPWNPRGTHGQVIGFNDGDSFTKVMSSTALGLNLKELILIGYFGTSTWPTSSPLYKTVNPNLIFNIENASNFQDIDYATGKNLFSFNFKTPEMSAEKSRSALLEEIHRTFKLRTSKEKRSIPVWKLIVIDEKKAKGLKTKGEKLDYGGIGTFDGFYVKNWPLDKMSQTGIIETLMLKQGTFFNYPILINQTGFNFNIDLVFKAKMADFEDVRKKLNELGLDIVLELTTLDCIVVTNN